VNQTTENILYLLYKKHHHLYFVTEDFLIEIGMGSELHVNNTTNANVKVAKD